MKPLRSLFLTVTAAALIAASGPAQSARLPLASPGMPSARFIPVAANCSAVGQAVAAENGGQLLRAVAVDRGGRTVCVITYTVPSRDGKPPRRVETAVDAG